LLTLGYMNGRLLVLVVGLASGLGACSQSHSMAADAQPPDAQPSDSPPADATHPDTSPADATDAGPPPGFLFYTETDQSELGSCCQSCTSSIDIRAGALTWTLTGAVTCHVTLTTQEAASFAQLATRPDVRHDLSDPYACADAGVSFATLTVGFDDGTTFDDPRIDRCDTGTPLGQLRSAAVQLVTAHCTVTCVGAADAAAD
jgi:hypothetical protein